MKLALALLAMVGLVVACERVVDLTPPDAPADGNDAAISELVDAGLDASDAASLPPDAAVDAP